MHKFLFNMTVIALFFVAVTPLAQVNAQTAQKIETAVISQSLESIEFQTFIAGFVANGALDESIRRVSKHRVEITACVSEHQQSIEEVTNTLGADSIRDLLERENLSLDEIRVASNIKQLNKVVAECKLLQDKSDKILDRLLNHQAELNKAKLLEKDSHLGKKIQIGSAQLLPFIKGKLAELGSIATISVSSTNALIGGVGILAFLFAGIVIRNRATLPIITGPTSFSLQFSTYAAYSLRKWSPLLLPALFAFVFLFFVVGYQFTHSNLNKLIQFGIAFVIMLVLLRAGARRHTNQLTESQKITFPGQGYYLRLVVSSSLLAMWMLFVLMADEASSFKTGESLFRTLLSIGILVSLIDLSRFIKYLPIPTVASVARWVSTIAFVISLFLETVGYHNLARFIWGGIVLSTIALTLFYVLERLSRDFYDGLETGKREWQMGFRKLLSVNKDEPIPGLVWLRLLSISGMWIGLFIGILKSWGTPDSVISSIYDYARYGFKIGDTLLTPFNIVMGIFVFSLMLMVFRWFRDGLDKQYLSKSRLDSGAREAMVTITGYVSFVIAALAGLSIAGVGFGNLAIVAGALSLGIGFGLQNIVNNFVSGIILLFERPIKTGDWIVIGSTEGYVKKIRVRSTEVQTFDRSDVIVPNSELISTQVTNWTLKDKYGRVKVSVGVAYGSDTDHVKEVLENVSRQNPRVIQNNAELPTKVLFMGFGDSTLDFQLRCFVYDVGASLDVLSELHFAINRAFRKHGIEIAFPQRDIYIRSNEAQPIEPSEKD
ncbi:MAG: small-conductance mechanosensitive channel [Polaribacter sp.]|jgi:small-conductance mechanosensitive channel